MPIQIKEPIRKTNNRIELLIKYLLIVISNETGFGKSESLTFNYIYRDCVWKISLFGL